MLSHVLLFLHMPNLEELWHLVEYVTLQRVVSDSVRVFEEAPKFRHIHLKCRFPSLLQLALPFEGRLNDSPSEIERRDREKTGMGTDTKIKNFEVP